jgi:hypothetical protein
MLAKPSRPLVILAGAYEFLTALTLPMTKENVLAFL